MSALIGKPTAIVSQHSAARSTRAASKVAARAERAARGKHDDLSAGQLRPSLEPAAQLGSTLANGTEAGAGTSRRQRDSQTAEEADKATACCDNGHSELVRLSKRTRIELLAANNDHNYYSGANQAAARHQEAARLAPKVAARPDCAPGPMDDCTAAMVLMFLSSRPNGKLEANEPREPLAASRSPEMAARRTLDAGQAKACVKRNSEPIEMDTSRWKRISGYQRHFKRRSPAQCLKPTADQDEQLTQPTAVEASPTSGFNSADQSADGFSDLDEREHEQEDDDDEEEDDDHDRLASPRALKPEDEMMFELQQVDQVAEQQAAAHAEGHQPQRRHSAGSNDSLESVALAPLVSGSPSSAIQGDEPRGPATETTELNKSISQPTGRAGFLSDIEKQLELKQKLESLSREPDDCQRDHRQLTNPKLEHDDSNQRQQQQLSSNHQAQQSIETTTTTKQMQQQQEQQHLRFIINNPIKTRTIFSCMWPGCTRNHDNLDEMERHVRAHLGPKQCDSIGEEDFYYEEMEVDDATYFAILSANNQLPLSPSHNSDGLSSGQSFASSSPATSPVCSTDGSSSSASSSSSSSSSSSTGVSALAAAHAGAEAGEPKAKMGGSSPPPGQFLYGGGWPMLGRHSHHSHHSHSHSHHHNHNHNHHHHNPNHRHSHHFLVDHSQLLRASVSQAKWLPSGVALAAAAPGASRQQQPPRRAAAANHQLVYSHHSHHQANYNHRHSHHLTGGYHPSNSHRQFPLAGEPAQAGGPIKGHGQQPRGQRISKKQSSNQSHQQKCRSVYGMEQRDLWCTQCKWKKACSRFCDQ